MPNGEPGPKLQKLTDGAGLQLWVQPQRRSPVAAGLQILAASRGCWRLGSTRTISLARASQAREGARRLLVDGIDPALEKERRTQEHIDAVTFRAVANEYVTKLKREGRAAATIAKTEWLLGFAHADLGNTPIKAVNAPAVLQVLRGVENRGRFEFARRLRSTIGSVFRYAIATARAEVDPTYSLRGALYPGQGDPPRAAITDPKALGALLRAIDGFSGQPGTRIALLLMAFLFPRPGELRAAAWVELDLERAIWTISRPCGRKCADHIVFRLPVNQLNSCWRLRPLSRRQRFVVSKRSSGVAPNLGQYAQRRFAPPRLRGGRGHRAWFSRERLKPPE